MIMLLLPLFLVPRVRVVACTEGHGSSVRMHTVHAEWCRNQQGCACQQAARSSSTSEMHAWHTTIKKKQGQKPNAKKKKSGTETPQTQKITPLTRG